MGKSVAPAAKKAAIAKNAKTVMKKPLGRAGGTATAATKTVAKAATKTTIAKNAPVKAPIANRSRAKGAAGAS